MPLSTDESLKTTFQQQFCLKKTIFVVRKLMLKALDASKFLLDAAKKVCSPCLKNLPTFQMKH